MGWPEVYEAAGVRVASRDMLIAHGASGRMLTAAVKSGHLLRARRDHYVLPEDSRRLVEAIRIGGRLACVSALADVGIFVLDDSYPHLHLDHSMSRLRSPRSRFVPLRNHNRNGAELHWWPLVDDDASTEFSVSGVDALIQAVRCQHPWFALASIDNALFTGRIANSSVPRIFENAPEQIQYLQTEVDGRAEAGQESVLRMIVRQDRLHCDLQRSIETVGRVDLVVEGCLVVEADSRQAHDGWEKHIDDRHRDLLLAKQRYMSLRPAYQHTMHQPRLVRESILGLLAQSTNFRRSFS
jgi:hypothetical protein